MHFPILIFVLYQIFDFANGNGRIYGGERVNIDEVPYMVHVRYLEEDGKYVTDCGGSILTKNLILTAGHCSVDDDDVNQLKPDRYRIRVGSSNAEYGGKVHRVIKVFTHPDYKGDDNNLHHDVAILQLKDDIELDNNSKLVQLAHAEDEISVGADTHVSGWGVNPDHPDDEDNLYQIHLTVMDKHECTKRFGDSLDFDKHEICVHGDHKSDCEGDSGGPLIYTETGRQIGIVSYGADHCNHNRPSVFSKVQDNFDFINSVKKQTGN